MLFIVLSLHSTLLIAQNALYRHHPAEISAADGYMTKPFTGRVLLGSIEDILVAAN